MIQNKENAEIIQNYVTTAMSNTTKVALEIIDKEYENKIALDNNQTKNVKEFVYTLGNVVKEFSENTFKIQKQITEDNLNVINTKHKNKTERENNRLQIVNTLMQKNTMSPEQLKTILGFIAGDSNK